ncbi:MAG: preprotein translocase subunit SecG [Victivallales bacterium]|nr:preprotein translocase subunit SecG [Victivallales bacterium]
MNIIITILTVLDVLIAILIIALVLVQQSKSSGLGTTFGGGGSDSLFGAHAESHLSRLTIVFASLFLAITLSLAILSAHQSKYKDSISDNILPVAAKTQNTEESPLDTNTGKPVVPGPEKADNAFSPNNKTTGVSKPETTKKKKGGI